MKKPAQRTRKIQPGRRGLAAFSATALIAMAAGAQVLGSDHLGFSEQLQACRSGATWQAREACMDEARAAQAARQRGTLANDAAYESNALARCDVFKEEQDKRACHARVLGPGETSGSVASGGILRSYDYTVPAGQAMGAGTEPAAAPPTSLGATPIPPLGTGALPPAFPVFPK
ncbi:hypothetical protein JI739_10770 [Ramlibacter sp. AW1]|uniref:DUF1190 domain-containing protein n=1 Tax=Ramlibacter aurantiacus TaxID=2801330 RepID=A0A936ZJ75_9BURK|nr:hypothetical protein [Ramlibacter aurantiacus]MBL0420827.1 hypothetical protein [Ramlibacter aurantiacus]